MKVFAFVLLIVALAVLVAVFVVVQPLAGKGPRWDGPRAEPGRLEQTVRALIALGPRHDQAGMARAVTYLAGELVGLEMSGCFSEPQKFPFAALKWLYPAQGDYIVVVGRPRDLWLVRRLKRGLAGTGLSAQSIDAPEAIPGIGNSDHRNYWKRGI